VKKLRTLATIIALVLAFAAPVAAQSTDTIRKGVAFSVVGDQAAADATTEDPTGFRLYSNGALLATKTAAEAGCSAFPCTPTFAIPGGMAKGVYVLFMESFNEGGAAQSTTLTLTVTAAPPKAPINIRIVKGGGL
jgi:hypothetical protein